MNKVFILPPNENWIIDRFVKEWIEDNFDITVINPGAADVIWLLADFCWRQIPYELLKYKKVITTVHHIVPEKFGKNEQQDFKDRDYVTDVYHVYNQRTYDFIKPLTEKPIVLIPYWADQRLFVRSLETRETLRKNHGLLIDDYIIGSFQRDTEGHDLKSPKKEKGPDLFCDFVENLAKTKNNVHVLLGGWRRQYVINRLKKANIPYSYFELPIQQTLNEFYQCLDCYVVSARHEGGPQSLIECGLLSVPTISTPVGIAEDVLPSEAINVDLTKASPVIPKIPNEWLLPQGYQKYKELINSL